MANNLEDQKKVKYKGLGGDTDEMSTACLHNPGEILRCKAPGIYNRKKTSLKICKNRNYIPKFSNLTPRS